MAITVSSPPSPSLTRFGQHTAGQVRAGRGRSRYSTGVNNSVTLLIGPLARTLSALPDVAVARSVPA